jgi:hypothetical protein
MAITETDELRYQTGGNLRILTTIEEGYNTDRYGPRENEEEGRQCNPDREVRAKILEYVVTSLRNNVLYCIRVSNQQKENG